MEYIQGVIVLTILVFFVSYLIYDIKVRRESEAKVKSVKEMLNFFKKESLRTQDERGLRKLRRKVYRYITLEDKWITPLELKPEFSGVIRFLNHRINNF